MGTESLSQGMALTTHPLLALRLVELYLHTSPVPLWYVTGLTFFKVMYNISKH